MGSPRRVLIPVVFLVFLSTLFSACSKAPEEPQVKNVLFIIMDTTVADHLAPWGYERLTTPYLDAFAEDSFVFRRMYSQAPSTLPSTWSFLTGRYPAPMPNPSLIRMLPDDATLADLFKENGFATFGFSENPYISESKGFDQGFQQFTYYRPTNRGKPGLRNHSATDSLFADARMAIDSAKDQPWFCYIHLLRPHEPYLAPEPQGTQFFSKDEKVSEMREKKILYKIHEMEESQKEVAAKYLLDSYDGNLAYVDFKIGAFLDELREQSLFENTVIVIASDHGEAFLEHGRIGHGFVLFEELLHVPLIFRAPEPAGIQAGVSLETAEMLDVYPTLVEIFGFEMRNTLHGRSLLSGMRGRSFSPKPAIFAQAHGTNLLSIRMGNLKMICKFDPNTKELSDFTLFDLEKDPEEQNSIYTSDYPVDEFLSAAKEYMARWPVDLTAPENDIPDELREDLEAIGYLGN